MEIIKKVAGIIIKNNKLLLVSAHNRKFFWLPGGKLNRKESFQKAIKRELLEEINIKPKKINFYCQYISDQEEDGSIRRVRCYIINYSGQVKKGGEINKIIWLNKKDIRNNKYWLQTGIKTKLIPKIIKDKLI